MDFKRIIKAAERLEELFDSLDYCLLKMNKETRKDPQYKNCVSNLQEMKRILDNEFSQFRKEVKTKINEEIDEKYINKLSEINSPQADALKRMGKLLGIKKAIMEGVVKTAESKHERLSKTATQKRQVSESQRL